MKPAILYTDAVTEKSPTTADSPEPAEPTRGAYHHGELPLVLMGLAIEAIAAKGTEALSLRSLAREAGVSATAPYRHFPSKRCLLAALAQRGFEDLTRRMRVPLTQQGAHKDRFIAMGLAYIEFAVNNPVAYQLMFGSVLADFSDYEKLHGAAEASYEQLLGELRLLIDAEQLDISPLDLSAIVWSGVHGMAALMINGMGKSPGKNTQGKTHRAGSLASQSIRTLHQNTEQAMRVMFGSLIGDTAGIHRSKPNG